MQGLKRRLTYDELIEAVDNSDDIIKKYPDRRVTFMRNHPYLTQLDGENFMDALTFQQNNIMKAQQKDLLVRQYASDTSSSHLETRSTLPKSFSLSSLARYGSDAAASVAGDVSEGSDSFRMTYDHSRHSAAVSAVSGYSIETPGGTRYVRSELFPQRPTFLPRQSMSEVSAISGRNSEERDRQDAADLEFTFEPSFD